MTANRIHTLEEKLKIVLEGMRSTVSVSDLCRKYDLKTARFYYLRDKLLNSISELIACKLIGVYNLLAMS